MRRVGDVKRLIIRRVAVAAAAVTALVGVAACGAGSPFGGSGDGDKAGSGVLTRVSPLAALRSADRSMDRADSAKVESTMTMGTQLTTTSQGTVAWDRGVIGNMTITYTGGTLADALRQHGAASVQARYLPDAYYANMGEQSAQRIGGKHWIRYGYDDLAHYAGGSGAYLKEQMQKTTPNQSVKLMLASGDVHKTGTEKVRGRQTTHYSGTVRMADFAAKHSDLTASQLDDLKRQLTAEGLTTETVDIWIDSDDLLVKMAEQGHMTAGMMSVTAYYSDYGVKVTAQAPPKSDTADFTDLIRSGQGQAQGQGQPSA